MVRLQVMKRGKCKGGVASALQGGCSVLDACAEVRLEG